MPKTSILVVGGTGTLGRQVVRKAIDEGYDVRCIVRPRPIPADFLRDWGATTVQVRPLSPGPVELVQPVHWEHCLCCCPAHTAPTRWLRDSRHFQHMLVDAACGLQPGQGADQNQGHAPWAPSRALEHGMGVTPKPLAG